MKKISMAFGLLVLSLGAWAQQISPYIQHKINQGVSVEVKEVKRVEKYGWDNFEVTYRLKNNTDYDLFKVDLTLYLVDKNDQQVGLINIHDFEVPSQSDAEYMYVDLMSPYVNEKFDKIIVIKNKLEVVVDKPEAIGIAKITCEPTLSYR